MDDPISYRCYGELAELWPLWSHVDHYEEEAEYAVSLLRRARREVHEVLELGSGGGHNAFHLKQRFELTLADLSERMLAVSAAANPECSHVQGDMRTLRLERSFDAVFLHDAVDYMVSEADLGAAFATAWQHCRPGGVLVVLPDHVSETFAPGSEHGGSDGPDGAGLRYLEWTTDPDPDDTCVTTEYAFITRDVDGKVGHHRETHVTGLFPVATWVRCLEAQGFVVETEQEITADERTPRQVFLGHRPLA